MTVTRQLLVAIDFHSMEKKYYGSQWLRQLFGYTHFSKYFLLCSTEKKKFIQLWNNMRVSKWWQNAVIFSFVPLSLEYLHVFYHLPRENHRFDCLEK